MKVDTDLLASYGVTYRQFDHWCRKGWIVASTPSGSGIERHFERTELDIFRMMASLVGVGFRPVIAAELARACIEKGFTGTLTLVRGQFEATGILQSVGSLLSDQAITSHLESSTAVR
jgi:hypothetical protein